jgi:hypothetical protein
MTDEEKRIREKCIHQVGDIVKEISANFDEELDAARTLNDLSLIIDIAKIQAISYSNIMRVIELMSKDEELFQCP